MTDALLIFTFSPIQSFIGEARRAADLYTGSQILVELAKAAGGVIEKHAVDGKLVYPAALTDDVPNKLVARISWENCEAVAAEARAALLKRWRELAEKAREAFEKQTKMPFDMLIWNRQTGDDYLWEIYWSAASLDGRGYKEAYKEAESGLTAAKFTRPFSQHLEAGFKDTLSGKREALHPKGQDGQKYWLAVGQIEQITPIKIRPSTKDAQPERRRPRERLDAMGIIKRFHPDLSEKAVAPFHGFPSTSSMASWSFLESAKAHEAVLQKELKDYRKAIERLLPEKKYKIRDDEAWPFDGDLLYLETLRPKRLESDYGKKEGDYAAADLEAAQASLRKLYAALKQAARDKQDPTIHTRPSPYYAIVVLDGDGMGEYLRTLDEKDHSLFSQKLRDFSAEVSGIANTHRARVIYNGGDDVLAFAPLDTAVSFARALADQFHEKTDRTASAGIAIAHHLSPLGAALRAARRAEGLAKGLREEKNAICVIALKRSGEPIEVRSGWEAVGSLLEEMIHRFEKDEISSKLPYDAARSAYALPDADDKFEAELRRLLKRHGRTKAFRETVAPTLAENLRKWAGSFPSNPDPDKPQPSNQLADWLALARFIAKGGRE